MLGALWLYGEQAATASGEAGAVLSWGIKKARRTWLKLATEYSGDLSQVAIVSTPW